MAKCNDNEKKMRHYGIGIDSGGTFTDGVIIDLSTGTIVKAIKVRTTHNHLLTGIRNCLHALNPNPADIAAVSLSTTLATNSVVEGKGADVGVFLLGQKTVGNIPSDYCFHIAGGHDSAGLPLKDLDLAAAEKYIEECKDKVSAFAVSGFMSVRNPEHEQALKEFIIKKYGFPVICGHELTSTLGAHERAVTATLNGRLIPVIKELIEAVKLTLSETGINAPLMLVRGDGSLVMADTALDRPIETMLSGPAASIIGARYLSKLQDAIVADMGGTTTDTAVIRNGLPLVSNDGAMVGGFLTRVKAVDIHTIGLGGDSFVQLSAKDDVKLGPMRVLPISVAALEYESIAKELPSLVGTHRSTRYQPIEFIALSQKGRNHPDLPDDLKKILLDGPRSIPKVGQALGANPDLLPIEQWIDAGLLRVSSLTPTDFIVATGIANVGDKEAAKFAIDMTCRAFSLTPEELDEKVMEQVNRTICYTLMHEAMGKTKGFEESNQFLINEMFDGERKTKPYQLKVKLALPVISVGAPVRAYYPAALKILDSELVIPDNSHVANAVGAITGQVVETVELLIRPDAKGFILYTPWEKYSYPASGANLDATLLEVKERAEAMAREYVYKQAETNGGHDIDVHSEVEDVRVNTLISAEERYFLESHVRAKAIGCAYKAYMNK